ncbi:hypothetical protein DM02DRAFT_632309 [Periconia macrospinosa]|uniref:Deoxyribonuclease NucA/NucB domain-containing protein n=1 Tax=Periconia macrospinosa TaxID=97972 RepID=A0A2V1DEN2_9PLEO|nr:hypothetical protein DM02DRAFT_632309 [Periconia macrospinosa]
MKLIHTVALAVTAAQAAVAAPGVMGAVEQRDSGLSARAGLTFVVECSPYTGTGGKKRKGAGDTCNTMCYGTNCKLKTKTFTFDGASKKTKDQRRTMAGCNPTEKNICKTDNRFKDKGLTDCDEFPLAATKEADKGGQVFRCVKPADNRSQGGQTTTMIKQCKGKYPCSFTFSFKGASPYKYCGASPNCKADDNLFTQGNKPVTKRDVAIESQVHEGGYFQLRSGATIYSPSDLAIGSIAVRNAYSNETNAISAEEAAQIEADGLWDEDEEDDEDDFIEDEVVAKL